MLTSRLTLSHLASFVIVSQHAKAGGSGQSWTRKVNKSNSGTVCVLLRVTAKTSDANLSNIRRSSINEDYYMVPVARSYNNGNWERVAGPYAQDLSITNCCDLVIPRLPNLATGKFILISFDHGVSSQEEVSRFFQQTTFGPNLSMINSWNYGNAMDREMGKWLSSQMDESQTPVTSHRAFFRERVDAAMSHQSADVFKRPRNPCAKHARWAEYSFTDDDYGFSISATDWNGQVLISVGWVDETLYPRTVMSYSDWMDVYDQVTLPVGPGIVLQFCTYRRIALFS